jgi:hypothetical protein
VPPRVGRCSRNVRFGNRYVWSVLGAGRNQTTVVTL